MKNVLTCVVLGLFLLVGCEKIQENSPMNSGTLEDLPELLKAVDAKKNEVIDLTGNGSEKNFISLVKIGGRVAHFGYDVSENPPQPIPYDENVKHVYVWIAEYPITQLLKIKSDSNGWWEAWILKITGIDLHLSFVFEKDDWITTKTNVITITDESTNEIGCQFINPDYYRQLVKPMVEQMIYDLTGLSMTLNTAMVATVGKSWASLNDTCVPHGDPGASVSIYGPDPFPPIIGPIYFNEYIIPDIEQEETSADGGVAFLNQPLGTYYITAEKPGFTYETVQFNVTQNDINFGVELYIAAPPYSINGSDTYRPCDNEKLSQ